MRVLIVDDHTLVRQGLRTLLELDGDIQIVGEASNSDEAFEKATSLLPDVILMDIRLPGENGIETVARIKQQLPQIAIIMLTMYDYDEYIMDAVKAGAIAYVLKSSSREDLVRSIREAYSGKSFMTPEIVSRILHEVHSETVKSADHDDGLLRQHLTRRQVEVLGLLTDGKTNKQIAISLKISDETVKTHIREIFKKLNVERRTQAGAVALRHKILQ